MANNVSTMSTDVACPIIALNAPAGTDSSLRARSGRMACNLYMFSVPNRHPWVVAQRPPVRERARVKHGGRPCFHVPERCTGINVHHP
eukprot:8373786-Lingulodinium_polyedra.AAC.1